MKYLLLLYVLHGHHPEITVWEFKDRISCVTTGSLMISKFTKKDTFIDFMCVVDDKKIIKWSSGHVR